METHEPEVIEEPTAVSVPPDGRAVSSATCTTSARPGPSERGTTKMTSSAGEGVATPETSSSGVATATGADDGRTLASTLVVRKLRDDEYRWKNAMASFAHVPVEGDTLVVTTLTWKATGEDGRWIVRWRGE